MGITLLVQSFEVLILVLLKLQERVCRWVKDVSAQEVYI